MLLFSGELVRRSCQVRRAQVELSHEHLHRQLILLRLSRLYTTRQLHPGKSGFFENANLVSRQRGSWQDAGSRVGELSLAGKL